MAAICPHCGSQDVQAMLGDEVNCLNCGQQSGKEEDGETELEG